MYMIYSPAACTDTGDRSLELKADLFSCRSKATMVRDHADLFSCRSKATMIRDHISARMA
jgi:hypothetical protein